jgi:hypothetical protein
MYAPSPPGGSSRRRTPDATCPIAPPSVSLRASAPTRGCADPGLSRPNALKMACGCAPERSVLFQPGHHQDAESWLTKLRSSDGAPKPRRLARAALQPALRDLRARERRRRIAARGDRRARRRATQPRSAAHRPGEAHFCARANPSSTRALETAARRHATTRAPRHARLSIAPPGVDDQGGRGACADRACASPDH